MKIQTKQFSINLMLQLIEAGTVTSHGDFSNYGFEDNDLINSAIFDNFNLPPVYAIETPEGNLKLISNYLIITLVKKYLNRKDITIREQRLANILRLNITILDPSANQSDIDKFTIFAAKCSINGNL